MNICRHRLREDCKNRKIINFISILCCLLDVYKIFKMLIIGYVKGQLYKK